MTRRSHRSGWLDLAVRQRQWQVELQQPALREALDAERDATHQQQSAQARLREAELAQRGATQSKVFTVDALTRHAAYAGHLKQALDTADEQARQATEAADDLRGKAQALLAERDALHRHMQAVEAQVRAQAQRRESREHDEHWLLRRPQAEVAAEDASE
jgi:predicted  nucleic acid-binding Zn-ribbon protein